MVVLHASQASTRLRTVPLPPTSHVQIVQQTPTHQMVRRRLHNAHAILGIMARVARVLYALQESLQQHGA